MPIYIVTPEGEVIRPKRVEVFRLQIELPCPENLAEYKLIVRHTGAESVWLGTRRETVEVGFDEDYIPWEPAEQLRRTNDTLYPEPTPPLSPPLSLPPHRER